MQGQKGMTWLINGSKNLISVLILYKIILFSILQWTSEAFYKDVQFSLWKCQYSLVLWVLWIKIQNSKSNLCYWKTIIIVLLFYFSFSNYTHSDSHIKHTFCQIWPHYKRKVTFRHLSDLKLSEMPWGYFSTVNLYYYLMGIHFNIFLWREIYSFSQSVKAFLSISSNIWIYYRPAATNNYFKVHSGQCVPKHLKWLSCCQLSHSLL